MNMISSMQLKWKLIFGFSLILGMVVPVSVITYNSLKSMIETSDLVNHTQQAIEYSANLNAAMTDMESGLRGFLVAGKDEFLQPYNSGQDVFTVLMETALLHVSEDSEQVARLREIESLKNQWLREHAVAAIDLRREVAAGASAAQIFEQLSARTVGKDRFDSFRSAMAETDEIFIITNDLRGSSLVQAIVMDMVDQETGQRGFLLTGLDESLEPYEIGGELLIDDVEALRTYISRADNPDFIEADEPLSRALEFANQWKIDAAEPEIEARRAVDQFPTTINDVIAFVETGIGNRHMDAISEILQEFAAIEQELIIVRNASAEATALLAQNTTVFGALSMILLGVLVTFFLTRSVLTQLGADPSRVKAVADSIAEGNLKVDMETGKKLTGIFASMATMRKNLVQRNEADQSQLRETGRIKQALDVATASVMLADADDNIIYMNDAVKAMFRKSEGALRQDLPGFDTNKLIGKSMDTFRSNSASQNSLITGAQSTTTAELKLGGLTFDITTTPIRDENGERIGTVVEWKDRTQELAVEEEVGAMVLSALAGDLSQRVSMEGKTGFFVILSEGINDLVNVCEQVVNDTIEVLGNLSRGDLTKKIERDYQGSFGTLKLHTNSTVDKLTEVVIKIKQSSDAVATGARELSQGNSNLSQRTEEQASTLEETSSSMEEMTTTVQQNAENAKEANALAMGAREKAEHGGEVVGKAVIAMEEINRASNRIADIISVIDEIAFQTNLLALNASVEAARAGEEGRGFAVVASEVRNLAGRSATAAKEIKELIEDSVRKVDEGSKLVDESGKTLQEIITAVQKVTKIVADISLASVEQAAGIEEVNKAITTMDENTQQNAALVEEAAAASEGMGHQADELNEQMRFFKVNESDAQTTTAPTSMPVHAAVESAVPREEEIPRPPAATKVASAGNGDWEEF